MPHKLEGGGLAAWVQVNGKKLQCYGTDHDAQRGTRPPEVSASCWIASQENETFSVYLSRTTRNTSCVADLLFDGHAISKKVIKSSDVSVHWRRKIVEGYRRPFTFSSQIVGDDDTLLDGAGVSSSSRIGEIKIRVRHITSLRVIKVPVLSDGTDAKDGILPPIQKIHETHVKASKAPHQIALGKATSKKIYGKVKEKRTYNSHETLATFTFRYRPLETLVDNGIADAPVQTSMPRHDPVLVAGTQQNTLDITPREYSSPHPVASSSLTRSTIKGPKAVKSSKIPEAASLVYSYFNSSAPASSPSKIARTMAADTTLDAKSEVKPRVKDIKEDPDEIEILEDEERLLLARLESVRDRKRKALDTPKGAAPKKVPKRESSVSRGCFTPGEVIDLT